MSFGELVEFENSNEEDQPEVVSQKDIGEAVVTSTDWTTETVISQMKRGNILLSPRFQRRDAWDVSRKSRFIESLFLGLPVPQIVLAEQKNQRGKFLVLDGKQRLLTLLQFVGQGQGKNNSFRLKNLTVRTDLHGESFESISGNLTLRSDLDFFFNQTVRTVVIRNWPDNDFLYLVFVRLNTGSVQLSPQELRQALFPGLFVDFVDDSAGKSPAIQKLLGASEPDFRMRDAELLLRHLAFRNFIDLYEGDLKKFLDFTCEHYNRYWDGSEDQLMIQFADFEKSIECCRKIFGDFVARRWVGNKYQGQFNRAVFDILSHYFVDENVREDAIRNKEKIEVAYKNAFARNPEFVDSVTTTTKSIGATFTRFSVWASVLNECLDAPVVVPVLNPVNNRISFGE